MIKKKTGLGCKQRQEGCQKSLQPDDDVSWREEEKEGEQQRIENEEVSELRRAV